MRWFNDCETLADVKSQYKKLAKQHHPDLGGDTLTMQEISKEYAFATTKVVKGKKLSEEETENEIFSSEAYRAVIEQIIHLEGITIELVGYWLWVTGNTYPVRHNLKSAGFLFASKILAWYFRTAEYKVSKSSGKNLDQIKNKYGFEILNEDKTKQKHQSLNK